jgi:hypothetical protein
MNKKDIALLILFVLLLSTIQYTFGQPAGADFSNNITETKTPYAAESLNTSGGTFTTVVFNSTTQNLKWKAYAGNVSGALVLDDGEDYSIYEWTLTALTGEVYASRASSITWSGITCADSTDISTEEIAMNHTSSSVDSIVNTFNNDVHQEFYVGTVNVAQSTCNTTYTWVNDSAQSESLTNPFQEMLLHDGTNMVYSTFINDDVQGFDFNDYDFQMILPEKGVGGYTATRYYFYLELQ